jgi:TM2 domain-containing membrane protein YozV
MIVELVATGFIAIHVTLVIVGHILLLVAILKCLREDRPKIDGGILSAIGD